MSRKFLALWRSSVVVLGGYLTQVQLPIDAWADDSATILRDFCSIVPGPLGRIVEISASPQSTASVAVERGPLTLNVPADSAGCYLRGGDIVKPGRATSVTILQPDGKIVTGDFNDRLVMPVVSDNGLSHAFWSFVHEWAGGDLAEARERARTLIGATRGGDDSPILIRGLFEAGMQRVDRSRPLEVQWQGGSFPFSIELEGPRGTTLPPIRQSVHSERVFRVKFHSRPTGEYRLIFTCCGGKVARFLDFLVVPPTEVPTTTALDQIDGQRARDLAQALWLLTQAPSDWRLDALSRLTFLAKDQHDPIARSIFEDSSNSSDRPKPPR